MALKKKPVTGMKDMLPKEMEIRDYVIQMIKDTYKTYGFSCHQFLFQSSLFKGKELYIYNTRS